MEAGMDSCGGPRLPDAGVLLPPAPATPRNRVCQRGSRVAFSSRYSCVVAREFCWWGHQAALVFRFGGAALFILSCV